VYRRLRRGKTSRRGITGFIDLSWRTSAERLRAAVVDIAPSLRDRGPDAEGLRVDAEAGAALGHRRPSITDLSPASNQPTISADGRFVIVHNGEIYNFAD